MQQHGLIKACWLALVFTLCSVYSVGAFPPLPSSFYGAVQQDGKNIPNGTLVEALIEGKVVAYSLSEIYQGTSVFSLDVPGDDTATDKVEGGTPGQNIEFRVGGVFADQTAQWISGVNNKLDLTLPAGNVVSTTKPSFTPVPSKTPIPKATDTLTVTQTPGNNSDHGEPTNEVILFITPVLLPTHTENQTIQEDLPEFGLSAVHENGGSSDPSLKSIVVAPPSIDEMGKERDTMAVVSDVDQGELSNDYTGLWTGLSLLLMFFLLVSLLAVRKKDRKERDSSLS